MKLASSLSVLVAALTLAAHSDAVGLKGAALLAAKRADAEFVVSLDNRAETLAQRASLNVDVESLQDEAGERMCDPGVGQIAGYLRLKSENKHYFFWFFESRNDPEHDPTTQWLTGGPGCSSLIALFHELGPCKVNEDKLTTRLNPHSWTGRSNMIFIDQPGETGFSYGDGDIDEEGVSMDLYIFATEFMARFPKYASQAYYIFGESYGGHYVPAFASRVFQENKRRAEGVPLLNLKGFGVGNGLTDSVIQDQYYAQMAFNSTTAPARVSRETYEQMLKDTETCVADVRACNSAEHPREACFAARNFCSARLIGPYVASGYNVYDMRSKCTVPPLCYDFSDVDSYANSARVQKYLGVHKKWESCNMKVNQEMGADFERNYQQVIPPMLEAGIRVLIYAGDCDYICNWLGNRAWTLELPWSGKDGFNSAGEEDWLVDGEARGKMRSHGGFTFLQVYQAGHMVPLDQPEASLAMYEDFISAE